MKHLLMIVVLILMTTSATAAGVQIIVHADNPTTSIDAATAQGFFFGKATRWSDGTTVVPIDQLEKSAVREEFSRTTLKKKVEAVKSYWLTMIFSGRGTPPVELKTDAAVMEAVRTQRGAIGYVSSETALGPGVRVLSVK